MDVSYFSGIEIYVFVFLYRVSSSSPKCVFQLRECLRICICICSMQFFCEFLRLGVSSILSMANTSIVSVLSMGGSSSDMVHPNSCP